MKSVWDETNLDSVQGVLKNGVFCQVGVYDVLLDEFIVPVEGFVQKLDELAGTIHLPVRADQPPPAQVSVLFLQKQVPIDVAVNQVVLAVSVGGTGDRHENSGLGVAQFLVRPPPDLDQVWYQRPHQNWKTRKKSLQKTEKWCPRSMLVLPNEKKVRKNCNFFLIALKINSS